MGAPEMFSEEYFEHLTGDPAYDAAFAALADCPSFAQVDVALKAYGHANAERLRTLANQFGMFRSEDMRLKAEALRVGADLIDPEVEA